MPPWHLVRGLRPFVKHTQNWLVLYIGGIVVFEEAEEVIKTHERERESLIGRRYVREVFSRQKKR
jgi:hypothetical protein